jgi:hypothetical protein
MASISFRTEPRGAKALSENSLDVRNIILPLPGDNPEHNFS